MRSVSGGQIVAAKQANRANPRDALAGTGAAIHPTFLRIGPWALSVVVAVLFGLSFATSFAALRDYAYQLQFSRTFATSFPLVLDAVIVVLAVTLLLERALGMRPLTLAGRHIGVRPPTWPLLALWLYFAASVAGNVGHAPRLLAAQLVAAVPPVSAALTFHLLLRLLDRASLLRQIAEEYEERTVDERARSAARKARRDAIKFGPATGGAAATAREPQILAMPVRRRALPVKAGEDGAGSYGDHPADLHARILATKAAGERLTGDVVAEWLGVSARTGRRLLAKLR
jgi:hypothetical protein